MSVYYGINTDNANQFFSSYSINQSNSSGGGSTILSDYASIKNGSYKKLLSAYYAKNKAASDSEDSTSGVKKEANKKLTAARDNAKELEDAVGALRETGKDDLFRKKNITVKDEITGEETKVFDYDRDAITSKVKDFVKSYNSLIESSADVDNVSILRKAAMLTGLTKRNENLLSEIGISIGKGNKLSLDEDKLKEANISTIKDVFQGQFSYGDRVEQKANQISDLSKNLINKSNQSAYNKNGVYLNSVSYGNAFDSYF